jgi:hypothetical protein
MNEFELKKLWQVSNDKLEKSSLIVSANTEAISRMSAHNFIGSMKLIKIITLLIGIIWVGIGATVLSQIYIHAFSEANKFFLISASVQVLLTAIAVIIYVYQLIKIYQVELSDPILITQKRIAQLKMSTLWSARILMLQLPVWTTFWWNETMLTEWSVLQWIPVTLCTLLFGFAAIWLFFNIKYENRNKKWFKLIFNGSEWTPLMKSMQILEQIGDYDDTPPQTTR